MLPQPDRREFPMPELIPWAAPALQGNESEFVQDALASTWISGGPYVDRFEREFSTRNESRFCITTSNGTTALQLALLGLGIGPGDEVIVPGFTFLAPANMVLAQGAKPVFVDVDPETWCVDPDAISRAITPHTRAILAVHLYGNVCDMGRIVEIARGHGVALIEDTAESAFSKWNGRAAGTFGDVGCFSFQATKTITTGEGGAVLTDRDDLFELMSLVRNHGMHPDQRYFHRVVGFNFRLTNMQAALGCAQLAGLEAIIESRKRLYEHYVRRLSDMPGVVPQRIDEAVSPVVWTLAVRLDPEVFGSRDTVSELMKDCGIETRPGFYTPNMMPLYEEAHLPRADQVSREVLCLPLYPTLSHEAIDRTCDALNSLRGCHAIQDRLSA